MLTPRLFACYLYLNTAEQMPKDAPDEWFLGVDDFSIDMEKVENFTNSIPKLVNALETYIPNLNEPIDKQYLSIFFDVAKDAVNQDKTQIREYFSWLYLVVCYRTEGPNWGKLIEIIGVDEFLTRLRQRCAEIG